VTVAAALSIVQIALPGRPIQASIVGQMGARGVIGTTPVVDTTVGLAPIVWLIACAAIIVSYARRPAPGASQDASTTSASGQPKPAAASVGERQSIDLS
jgi:hypothetical protein